MGPSFRSTNKNNGSKAQRRERDQLKLPCQWLLYRNFSHTDEQMSKN